MPKKQVKNHLPTVLLKMSGEVLSGEAKTGFNKKAIDFIAEEIHSVHTLCNLILIIGGVVGVYFYNFYVFKEIRVCIGESKDTQLPCIVRDDCLTAFNISLSKLDGSPEFVVEAALGILNEAVYCEEACFVRDVRGIDFENGGLEELGSCGANEEEIVLEIRGKEGIGVLDWVKSKEQ